MSTAARPTAPRSYATLPLPLEEPDAPYVVHARARVLRRSITVPLPDGNSLDIPRGFVCDGASIPRWALCFIAERDLSLLAPLVHDYLYARRGAGYSREECDDIFLALMERQGVTPWKRQAAYLAVRLCARNWAHPQPFRAIRDAWTRWQERQARLRNERLARWTNHRPDTAMFTLGTHLEDS